MLGPMKQASFSQAINEQSSTCKELIGTLRITHDGRKFRYAKAGAALSAGTITAAAQLNAAHVNESVGMAVDVGETQLTLAITQGAAIAENQLVGGFLQINAGDGAGYQYSINGNSELDAAGTSITISLAEPIRKVLAAATSKYTLIPSPWYGVVTSAVEENLPAGVPIIDVDEGNYFWCQTGGEALVKVAGAPTVGTSLTLSSTPGSLAATTTPLVVDIPPCGILWGTVGVAGEFKPVKLLLD
jgi:hypothetical protein